MRISIWKAEQIANRIESYRTDLIPRLCIINEFESPEHKLDNEFAVWLSKFSLWETLVKIKYELIVKCARAAQRTSLDQQQAEYDQNQELIEILDQLIAFPNRLSKNEILSQLAKLSKEFGVAQVMSSIYNSSVLADLSKHVSELQLTNHNLMEDIFQRKLKSTIEISDHTAEILKNNQLL